MPKSDREKLKMKLDRCFALYIRLKDCSTDGYVKCISCGKFISWEEADSGHFVNRSSRNERLRYSETNCHAQCRRCNRFFEGNAAGYAVALMSRYGENIINKLALLQGLHETLSCGDFQILIDFYEGQLIRVIESFKKDSQLKIIKYIKRYFPFQDRYFLDHVSKFKSST